MKTAEQKAAEFLEHYFEDDELNSPFASKEMIVESLVKLLEEHQRDHRKD